MQDISSDTGVVRIYSTGEAKDVTAVGNITEYNPSSLKNAISLDVAAQPVSESFFLWDHLRRAAGLFFEAIPYFAFTPDFEGLPELDLDAYPVSLGDYAEVKLVEPYTNSVVVVNLPILARSSRCLFVDWLDLLIALNAHPSNTGEDTKEWSAADLTTGGGLSIELMSCTRARRRRPVDDLTSIPIIKSDTMDVYGDVEKAKKQFNYETSKLEHVAVTENVLTTTVLYEGMDYRIKGGSIAFEDYLIGKAVCTAGNPVLVLEDGLITHEMFRGEATLDELGASCVLLFGGDSGIYKPEPVFDIETESAVSPEVGDILFDMKIAVSPAPRVSGTVDICIPRFCAYTPVPGELWAEVSYFDNWQTIENNFGMFVGFPKSLVDAHDPTLDYLSVIKSLWFAFMNGPDFENLDLAVEAFFNVPFSDVACQVVYVDEGDVTIREKGKIVVYETEEGRYRTYTYPSGASLAINPRSSKLYGEARRVTAYKLISSEEEKEALSEDERKLYEDSILDPYTKFIDFADIVDYVLDPELIDRQLQGEDTIKKYHTFLVDVPLSIAGSTKVFPLVKAFLSEARPAYTNFILVGSFKLEDAISAVDEETLMPTLHVKDTPHTAPFFAQALDVDSFELPIVSSASEGLLWPQEKTEEKGFVHIFKVVPGGVGSKAHGLDDDVKNKYESGYCEGVLDDYSGDGSWNRNHRLLDMVNTCDSDIDVINSRLWIPVTISGFTGNGNPAGEDNPDSEFVLGEEVEVWLRDGLGAWEKPESVWIDSPPAVLHVGAGHHPKVPGPDSPQHDHSNSYIILGFEGKNFAEKNDYADEARLDVLGTVGNDQGKLVWLYGVTSGATALVSKVSSYIPDDDHPADEAGAWHTPAEQTYQTRSNPKHKHLFLLEHIWQGDKLLEYGPKSDPELTVTTYIPITGLPAEGDSAQGIDGLAQRSPIFEPATSAYALQVQMYPYTTEVDDDRQFVPSFNPGLLNKWSDLQDPVNENIVWGYTDAGPAAVNPLTEWALPTHAPSNPLRNVHIGMQFKARKDMHLTHGFCDFFIPGPKIVQIGPGATKQMRVEGYYFCDDDSTRVGIPPISADPAYPNGYGDPPNDGEIGGSWVFFRHSAESAIEVPVGEITFEVGVNPGRTVCGINAEQANQTSTGHILEVDIPPLPKEGYYDVIVRNFRPYKMGQNSSWTYHVDEDVIEKGYNHIAGEWSGGAWGTDPFGGGT